MKANGLTETIAEITTLCDRNTSQMNGFMDALQQHVLDLSQTRVKMNEQHQGTMTTVEQEMERLCEAALRSARS